ncbi:MAG: hypothetical protein HC866_02375 [Leptolyngbyaceae cyanobacterium RU_5_1]|nr:hypothetical protein [Leptolyngbyaceae cyanobacterium RU_5_1]
MVKLDKRESVEKPVENPEYLRGYRDGQKAGKASARSRSGDGILGALLATALIAGIGYVAYEYAQTGKLPFPIPRVQVQVDTVR